MVASGNLGTIRIVAGMVSFTFPIFIIVAMVAIIATASAATATILDLVSALASSASTKTSMFISAVGLAVSVDLTDIESILFGGLVGGNEQLEESHTFIKFPLKCRASQDVVIDNINAIGIYSSVEIAELGPIVHTLVSMLH